jgi:hypothetical protein
MQREKASSWEFTDPPACDEPPELVADGLELQAASRAVTAMAVQEHSVRARLRRSLWRTSFTRGHLPGYGEPDNCIQAGRRAAACRQSTGGKPSSHPRVAEEAPPSA